MNLAELTHGDPDVIRSFDGINRELVIEFLKIRKLKGKANHRIAMMAVFRQLDQCTEISDKELTLECAVSDNSAHIYAKHLPNAIRFPDQHQRGVTAFDALLSQCEAEGL